MRLANPLYLLWLVPVAVFLILYVRDRIGREATLKFSNLELVRAAGAKSSSKRRWVSALLRAAALTVLIVALARPQTGHGQKEEIKHVVDIMLSIDTSTSMETLDFNPENRLGAAKLEARRFIESRPHDRIGFVVFAATSVTMCPLTTDRAALLTILNNVRTGMLEDGTAIGVGLASAVNRLRESEAKSKVVILLTDGVNNSGEIDPLTAAKIAKEFKIRVYTIGVGVDGEAMMPVRDPQFGQRLVRVRTVIDEKLLNQISSTTGGRYFRATDEKGLRSIFGEIDKLEKTEIKIDTFTTYDEHFAPFLWWGFALLLAEMLVMNLLLKRVP